VLKVIAATIAGRLDTPVMVSFKKKQWTFTACDHETSPDDYSTVIAPTLLREQPRETHRRAQLQRFRFLLSRDFEP